MRWKYFISFFILSFGILSKAEVSLSCSSFYQNTTKQNIFIQRSIEMIPFIGLGKKIQNMAKEELKLRRNLTSKQFEQRQKGKDLKSLSIKLLWSGSLNYLTNKYLGVWGVLPNIDLLKIKKLTNQELELLSNSPQELSFKEIFKYFGKWKPLAHEAIRVWSFAMVTHLAYGLAENPELLQQLKIGIQSSIVSISTSNTRLAHLQNTSYSEEQIRDLALEKWKASFKITEGRSPDPEKFHEDKIEWEKVYSQIKSSPIEKLKVYYSIE